MTHDAKPAATEFDAAKTIVETVKGMDKAQQERVLRWVAESLGVQAPPAQPAALPVVPVHRPEGTHRDESAELGRGTDLQQGTDIRTFVRSRGPKSDNQLAATVAYFYKFVAPPAERKDAIDGTDLAEAIRLVSGWKQPKRPQMTLNNAKNQGYLDPAGDGKLKLNSVGENLVTMTLGGGTADVIDSRKRSVKRRAAAKKSKSPQRK